MAKKTKRKRKDRKPTAEHANPATEQRGVDHDAEATAKSSTVQAIHVRPTTVLADKIATPERGDCPYALLIGAGASVSSGIKSAGSMIAEWKRQVFATLHQADAKDSPSFEEWCESGYDKWRETVEREAGIDRDDSDYGALFSYFFPKSKERQTYIEKLMKDAKPAFGYLYLAGLINDKRFNRILTTNFDDLLNDALIHYYEARPVVYSFDSSLAGARIAGKRPKIIKLHGNFLYDNLKNVRNEVHALEANMEKKLYEACKDSGLIVVGYSGNDESIMAPLRDMLRKQDYLTYGLHWCLYVDPNTGQPQVTEDVVRLARNHRADVHFYAMPSFDVAMEVLFRKSGCPLPHALMRPHEKSLPKRFYDSVAVGSSSMLTKTMHADLYDIMRRAGQPIDEDEYKVLDAELSWKWGVIARNDRRFSEAGEWFEEGMAKLSKLVNADGTLTEQFRDVASPNAMVLAMRRYAGLLIAQAKLALAQQKTSAAGVKQNAVKAFSNVVKIVQNGMLVLSEIEEGNIGRKGRGVTGLTDAMRRTLFYQGLCAYGLLKGKRGRLDTSQWKEVDEWETTLRRLDIDGDHFAKLKKDSDYAPLMDRTEN